MYVCMYFCDRISYIPEWLQSHCVAKISHLLYYMSCVHEYPEARRVLFRGAEVTGSFAPSDVDGGS